jgi:hypothetical protein
VIGFEKRRQLRNEKTTKNKREREVIKSIANNIRMTGKKDNTLEEVRSNGAGKQYIHPQRRILEHLKS